MEKLLRDIEGWAQLEPCQLDQLTDIFKIKETDKSKFVPESVEGRVEYKGKVSKIIYQLQGGLRSSMGYIGAKNLQEINKTSKIY